MDNTFWGPYGVYYLIGYAMVSIWSSFYGKLPSAYISMSKEDNIITCYDGVETYEIVLEDIKQFIVSKKKIVIDIPSKKVNLIHLSLDEKEMRLVSNYCRSQLRITPTIVPIKEKSVRLQ